MKKIISILSSFTLFLTGFSNIIACSNKKNHALKNSHSHKLLKGVNIEEELETNLTVNDLKGGIDGSHFTTNNTIGNALDKIQENIMQNFPNIAEIILPDENETQEYLKAGNNTVNIGIKPTSKDKIKRIKTVIKNVQKISHSKDDTEILHDESKTIELITKKFVDGLDASHLNGWNTIYDALEYFQNEAKKINRNAIISFTDKYLDTTIGENAFKSFSGSTLEMDKDFLSAPQLNYDKKNINIINHKAIVSPLDTVAPGSTFLLSALKWIGSKILKETKNAMQLIYKGVKYVINKTARITWYMLKNKVIPSITKFSKNKITPNLKKELSYVKTNSSKFTTWLTEKFHKFTHIKDAFLTGKKQAFDLNLTFTDPLENSEATIQSINIKAKIWGIQERSRENAKKIIEKERLPFEHAVNYNSALDAFRKHIEAIFLPTQAAVDQTKAFQLRTILKNKHDGAMILKKGLNLIPVVLKPANSWKNWAWGLIGKRKSDLDVQIHVYLK